MALCSLMIANRGEVVLRVVRTARRLGVRTVAIHGEDDVDSLHVGAADAARVLPGGGVAAYLDGDAIVAAALGAGCEAVHPGWGFLAESAEFARACEAAGLRFVGPRAEVLDLFGDKTRALGFAESLGVPVNPGTRSATTVEEALGLLATLETGQALGVKALAGGGGRGIRVAAGFDELERAFARSRSEARTAFGRDEVYVERWLEHVRHIEVQIAGDGSGAVAVLGERECTLQRRHQKLIEIAPAPFLDPGLRAALHTAARRMAEAARFDGLGTFEFLVETAADRSPEGFVFIEANPRLQVEHTVTEEVLGLDLVEIQLALAAGRSLADLPGLREALDRGPRGFALQCRINAERHDSRGAPLPANGVVERFTPPDGGGVRIETAAHVGYRPAAAFDPLLAKLIVHATAADFATALGETAAALARFEITGIDTNQALLAALLARPEVARGRAWTTLVEERFAELCAPGDAGTVAPHGVSPQAGPSAAPLESVAAGGSLPLATSPQAAAAGAPLEAAGLGRRVPFAPLPQSAARAPLESLSAGPLGRAPARDRSVASGAAIAPPAPSMEVLVCAPLRGTVVSIEVTPGEIVEPGRELVILEAMKMEHVVAAPGAARVRHVEVVSGQPVAEGAVLLRLEAIAAGARLLDDPRAAGSGASALAAAGPATTLTAIGGTGLSRDHESAAARPDLVEVQGRRALVLDEARPEAVARRRKTGQRTARENLADLCDPGSFVEYGPLVIAAQRRRRALDDLARNTPADGLVGGIASVNASEIGAGRARCVIVSYDYTVLAGTQGAQNHRKKDRLFELAARERLPVVLFAEGGGGRPGDTDAMGVTGLDCLAFALFAGLAGKVPLVGIASGRCFAGNAALLGCCDVVIATPGTNIGMGGPAMIEGGGLGVFRPEEIGPLDVQLGNGVVDVAARDEADAVALARRALSYFQGATACGRVPPQEALRARVPENRLRIYDVRAVVEGLADEASVLELRREFGRGMMTALARVEGRPLGIVANDPAHLAGAIDGDGADKASRFLRLCNAFGLPVLFLCDTPGIMVGPEAEATGLVRRAAGLFVAGAELRVPFGTIVLRKGYGLGAQAMAGGSFKAPLFTVAWPTGEFGGMGLEGAVRLGFRKELEAVEDPEARRALFDAMVGRAYQHGKALNTASHFEIDDVIDPADSRRWIQLLFRDSP